MNVASKVSIVEAGEWHGLNSAQVGEENSNSNSRKKIKDLKTMML